MLLRKVTQHVKDQNWFAVALDFFIVVVGILIAFQITNWNEARQQKVSERNYLERLHNDIIVLSEQRWRYDFQRPVVNEVLEQLTEFLDGDIPDLSKAESLYQGAWPDVELTPRRLKSMVCNSLDWSSYFTKPPTTLPTISELVSAGHLDRIQSRDIRAAILSYTQEVSRAKDFTDAMAKIPALTSRIFPEYFTIRYPNEKIHEGDSEPEFTCDYDAMRRDNAFLNAANNNRDIYKRYTDTGILPVGEKLRELHALIDEALGLDHSPAGT